MVKVWGANGRERVSCLVFTLLRTTAQPLLYGKLITIMHRQRKMSGVGGALVSMYRIIFHNHSFFYVYFGNNVTRVLPDLLKIPESNHNSNHS